MRRGLAAFGGILWLVATVGHTLAVDAQGGRVIRLARITGTIDPASSNYLVTAIHAAESENAEALIVELDTPGGLVTSVREMAQAIDRSRVPVVVYVTPAGASATSAGALLALASHFAAMAPGTNLGAAHPVDASGKDVEGTMKEKAANDVAAFARSLAELRKRNRELAEKIVLKSQSLTAQEARDQGVVELVVATRDELLMALEGRTMKLASASSGVGAAAAPEKIVRTAGAEVRTSEMTWGQKLLHFLANPNIATLLMTIGMLCIYVEITTPGITIPGVLGVIFILVAFMAYQMMPIRMGGLLLLVLGAGMLIAEAFATTHGALALGGTVAFILGSIWVMDPEESSLRVSPSVWIPAALGLGGGAMLIAVAAARGRRLVSETLARIGGGAASGLSGYQGHVESVIEDGRKGKALFRGELWDFECERPLKVGDWVEVERVVGMRAYVKEVKQS